MSFINVAEWSPENVAEWLKGLDDSILPYVQFFVNNGVNGCRLLLLSSQDLSNLNLTKIGHQEVILDAVDLLRHLHYNLQSETLQSLALRLGCKARSLYNQLKLDENNLINQAKNASSQLSSNQSSAKSPSSPTSKNFFNSVVHGKGTNDNSTTNSTNECDSNRSNRVSTGTLSTLSDILASVKSFISWIDRYPLEGQAHYIQMRKQILKLSIELASTAQRDQFVDKPNDIIKTNCIALADLCDKIVQELTDPLAIHPAYLELVTVKKEIDEEFGMHIHSSYSGVHIVGGVKFLSPCHRSGRIDSGDEIIQVNYQTVVGWQLKKLVNTIKDFPVEILLTVKKRPKQPSNVPNLMQVHNPIKIPSSKEEADRLKPGYGRKPKSPGNRVRNAATTTNSNESDDDGIVLSQQNKADSCVHHSCSATEPVHPPTRRTSNENGRVQHPSDSGDLSPDAKQAQQIIYEIFNRKPKLRYATIDRPPPQKPSTPKYRKERHQDKQQQPSCFGSFPCTQPTQTLPITTRISPGRSSSEKQVPNQIPVKPPKPFLPIKPQIGSPNSRRSSNNSISSVKYGVSTAIQTDNKNNEYNPQERKSSLDINDRIKLSSLSDCEKKSISSSSSDSSLPRSHPEQKAVPKMTAADKKPPNLTITLPQVSESSTDEPTTPETPRKPAMRPSVTKRRASSASSDRSAIEISLEHHYDTGSKPPSTHSGAFFSGSSSSRGGGSNDDTDPDNDEWASIVKTLKQTGIAIDDKIGQKSPRELVHQRQKSQPTFNNPLYETRNDNSQIKKSLSTSNAGPPPALVTATTAALLTSSTNTKPEISSVTISKQESVGLPQQPPLPARNPCPPKNMAPVLPQKKGEEPIPLPRRLPISPPQQPPHPSHLNRGERWPPGYPNQQLPQYR